MIDTNIIEARKKLEEANERLLAIAKNRGGIVFLSDVVDELFRSFTQLAEVQTHLDIYVDKHND